MSKPQARYRKAGAIELSSVMLNPAFRIGWRVNLCQDYIRVCGFVISGGGVIRQRAGGDPVAVGYQDFYQKNRATIWQYYNRSVD
jgi:hypothetical protein